MLTGSCEKNAPPPLGGLPAPRTPPCKREMSLVKGGPRGDGSPLKGILEREREREMFMCICRSLYRRAVVGGIQVYRAGYLPVSVTSPEYFHSQ